MSSTSTRTTALWHSQSPPATVSLLLAMLCALSVTPSAISHGLMCTPRQRAAYQSSKCGHDLDKPENPVTDYCAHCLNGGTVATVSANLPTGGWKIFDPVNNFDGTSKRAGLCGDPKGHHDHMIGGDFMPERYGTVPIVEHYKTGGKVDFVAEIDTNHNGYFEYFLCNIDKCDKEDIHASCFKNGHCEKLMRVPHQDCQNTSRKMHYECGPIDYDYPGRWYLPCRNTGHVGVHIVGGPSGTMRYQLPPGVTCKHCVIQWYWATANSCAPRGLLAYMSTHGDPFGTTCESDGGGIGTYRPGMHECGGDAVPEEFWSCADVSISNSGREAGPVQLVAGNFTETRGTNNDEQDAKEDPDKTAEKVQDELKKDIEMTANENVWGA